MTTGTTPERKRERRLRMLRRRADHLEGRIAANPDKHLSFDKAELSALRWAVSVLDPQPEPEKGTGE